MAPARPVEPGSGDNTYEERDLYRIPPVIPSPSRVDAPTEGSLGTSWLSRPLRLSQNPNLINKNEAGNKRLFAEGWENVTLTAPQLADQTDAGVAYSCELRGRRRKESFQASDVLSVDIDGGRRIEEV